MAKSRSPRELRHDQPASSTTSYSLGPLHCLTSGNPSIPVAGGQVHTMNVVVYIAMLSILRRPAFPSATRIPLG